jgi:hypothetical protein
MENLNYKIKDKSIKYKFDLKGSIRNRFTEPSEEFISPEKITLKDINFNQIEADEKNKKFIKLKNE